MSKEKILIKKVINNVIKEVKVLKKHGFSKMKVKMLMNATYIQKLLDNFNGYCLVNETNSMVNLLLQNVETKIENIYTKKPDDILPMEMKIDNTHLRIYDNPNNPIAGRMKGSFPENCEVHAKCPIDYEFIIDEEEFFCSKNKKQSLDE